MGFSEWTKGEIRAGWRLAGERRKDEEKGHGREGKCNFGHRAKTLNVREKI